MSRAGRIPLLALLLAAGCASSRQGFRREGDRVVFRSGVSGATLPVPQADAASFRALDGAHGVDKDFVFVGDRVLAGADPRTFRLVRPGLVRDDRFLFFQGEPVPACQAASFRRLDDDWWLDDRCAYAGGEYVAPRVVDGSDPGTFQPLTTDLAKDGRSAYFGSQAIEGADAASFVSTCAPCPWCGQDRDRCYARLEPVPCGCAPGAPGVAAGAARPAAPVAAGTPSEFVSTRAGLLLRGRLVSQDDDVDVVELARGTRVLLPGGTIVGLGASTPAGAPSPVTWYEDSSRLPLLALRLSAPQVLSLAVGVSTPAGTPGSGGLAFAQVEPGLGGLKLHAGYAKMAGILVFGARATYLRTWGHPLAAKAGRDYLGGEVSMTVAVLNAFVGAYRWVGARAGEQTWLVSAGAGVALGP